VSRRVALALAALTAVLAVATPALASESQPTLAELESEVYCPTCKSLLSLSNAPIAQRMRQFIREEIAAGATKSEIKDALVAQFGEAVLAAPPKEGFNLLVWVLPFVGIVLAGGAIAFLVVRWTRSGRDRQPGPPGDPAVNGRRTLDPELERRLDEELARFDG
jgi:cytochrome c-type biogenesis protein CcmH/NrfF